MHTCYHELAVINKQDVGLGWVNHFELTGILDAWNFKWTWIFDDFFKLRDVFWILNGQKNWQNDRELCSLAFKGVNADFAAHQLDQNLTDGKTKTSPLRIYILVNVQVAKVTKQGVKKVGRDAWAKVLHGQD